jgi:hypothetical protein
MQKRLNVKSHNLKKPAINAFLLWHLKCFNHATGPLSLIVVCAFLAFPSINC